MAYRVEIAARATRDLNRLYRRINAADTQVAAIWFNKLERAILDLADNPERCPTISEDERLRHLLYGRGRDVYRVIFKIDPEAVVVLHIRHGARKPL